MVQLMLDGSLDSVTGCAGAQPGVMQQVGVGAEGVCHPLSNAGITLDADVP